MLRKIDSRLVLAAMLACLAFAALSLVLRPLWRDEYWALFFSDPSLGLSELIGDRLVRDVHPPLYFLAVYAVRHLFEDPLALRALNLVALAGAGLLAWRLHPRPGRKLILFVFLCLTSYWAIFFSAEVRPYALLYSICVLATMLLGVLATPGGYSRTRLAAFCLSGAAAGLLHYFAALFIALGGLALGLVWLSRGDRWRFVWIGLAATIAVMPAAGWIVYTSSDITIPPDPGQSLLAHLESSLEQFLRGLLVKTFGSNLAATILAGTGVAAALRARNVQAGTIAFAVLGTVLGVFTLDLFWTPMIKERAFIVIMPGVVWLMVEAVSHAPQRRWTDALARAIPVVAIVTPLAFAGEHFKDRERFDEVRAVYEAAGHCEDARIYAFFRTYQHPAYFPFFTRAALTGRTSADAGPDLVDVDSGVIDLSQTRGCAITGVAVGLSRGNEALREQAREAMWAAGLDPDTTEEVRVAEGRHLIFLQRSAERGGDES